MEGHWMDDADRAVRKMAGHESAESWPPADVSKNLFRDVVNQISVLHDSASVITNEDAPAAKFMRDVLTQPAKLTPILGENQRNTEGLRESFVRMDVVEINGQRRVAYRVVPPDLLIAQGHANDPTVPTIIEEYRPRVLDGKQVWTRDVLDISGKVPAYRVELLEQDKKPRNITKRVLGTNPKKGSKGLWSGKGYPYTWTAGGTPYIPGTLYHANPGKWRTWDPRWGFELVEATLRTVAYWTFWGFNVMDASWPQRYGLDVKGAGGVKLDAKNSRATVDSDATAIMLFKSIGEGGGSLGNFPAGADPKDLGEAIRAYAADAVSAYGINPADAQRVSADPRSGYAISLSRSTVREQQDKQIPIFKPFDAELLAKTAATWNRLGGMDAQLPETGWEMNYTGLPLTAQERAQALAEWSNEAKQGVASKVDLHMRIHRVGREEAKEAMRRLRLEDAEFGAPGAAAPAPLI